MRVIGSILFFLIGCLFLAVETLADVVVLKSGKRIEGAITEETKDYIAVMYNGSPVYYDRKYIASIEKAAAGSGVVTAPEPSAAVPAVASPVPAAAAEKVVEDDRGFLERGLDAGINRRFAEAGRALSQGLKLYPDDDQLTGALDIIQKVEAGKVTADYAVNVFQGFKYALLQQFEDAKRYLLEAYKTAADDVDLNYNLGIVESELGNYENAVKYLQKVADAEPDSGEIFGRIGNAYYMFGDYQRAQENLMIAMALFRRAGDTATADEIRSALDELQTQ